MTTPATRPWRNFDPLLVLITIALVGFGTAMLYSSSYNTEDGAFWSQTSPAGTASEESTAAMGTASIAVTPMASQAHSADRAGRSASMRSARRPAHAYL